MKPGFGKDRKQEEKKKIVIICILKTDMMHLKIFLPKRRHLLYQKKSLKKYLKKIPENYNLPNVMLTTLGQYYHENIIFIPISFRPRQGGINSINMKKIFKIGRQALIDFRNIKKAVMIDEKR